MSHDGTRKRMPSSQQGGRKSSQTHWVHRGHLVESGFAEVDGMRKRLKEASQYKGPSFSASPRSMALPHSSWVASSRQTRAEMRDASHRKEIVNLLRRISELDNPSQRRRRVWNTEYHPVRLIRKVPETDFDSYLENLKRQPHLPGGSRSSSRGAPRLRGRPQSARTAPRSSMHEVVASAVADDSRVVADPARELREHLVGVIVEHELFEEADMQRLLAITRQQIPSWREQFGCTVAQCEAAILELSAQLELGIE
mmetsp:Transcript_91186/g.244160  ORF Transcript_91186/g.244160 Transcript_91186/m.244160 type:complete len:255 (-) Transcript_91186:58-822(-)